MRGQGNETGSILLAVVVVVMALAGLSAAFLQSSVTESTGNVTADERARVWYIAESGVNHAASAVLKGKDGMIGSKDNPVVFGGGDYWVKTVDNGDGSFTVTSVARLNQQRRAVEVVLAPKDIPIFSKALFGDLDLGAQGTVFTDSFDSELGTYASQATKTHPVTGHTYAGTLGHLGSNRNIILRGGVTVLGNAQPGPGYTVQISGTNVYIDGTTAPAASPTVMTPVEYNPPIASAGDLTVGEEKIFTAGVYRYDGLNLVSNSIVRFQGDVVLYLDDRFDMASKAQIIVEKDATVTVYHDGDDFKLAGGGVINDAGTPTSFTLMTSATSVKYSGTSSFYGAIYAPNATIDPTGTTDIYGSFIGRSISISGTANFHYDEVLGRKGVKTRSILRQVSWRRVPLADM